MEENQVDIKVDEYGVVHVTKVSDKGNSVNVYEEMESKKATLSMTLMGILAFFLMIFFPFGAMGLSVFGTWYSYKKHEKLYTTMFIVILITSVLLFIIAFFAALNAIVD